MKNILVTIFMFSIILYTQLPKLFAETQPVPVIMSINIPILTNHEVDIANFGLRRYEELRKNY